MLKTDPVLFTLIENFERRYSLKKAALCGCFFDSPVGGIQYKNAINSRLCISGSLCNTVRLSFL